MSDGSALSNKANHRGAQALWQRWAHRVDLRGVQGVDAQVERIAQLLMRLLLCVLRRADQAIQPGVYGQKACLANKMISSPALRRSLCQE